MRIQQSHRLRNLMKTKITEDSLRSEISKLSGTIRAQEKEIVQLKVTVSKLTATDRERSVAAMVSLQMQMQQITNCFEQALTERDAIASDLTHLQIVHKRLGQDLGTALNRITQLQNDLEHTIDQGSRIDFLEKENQRLIKEIFEWQNHHRHCMERSSVPGVETSALEQELEMAQERIRVLEDGQATAAQVLRIENERMRSDCELLKATHTHQLQLLEHQMQAVEGKYRNILVLNAVLETQVMKLRRKLLGEGVSVQDVMETVRKGDMRGTV
eukprot:c10444_g1_i1.p1 GENE.c10444_g1_i1~~c10444_g1_i1.p1  ORF type:complete len:272 (-),score=57.37 c10444_g1_i1:42-857(-)